MLKTIHVVIIIFLLLIINGSIAKNVAKHFASISCQAFYGSTPNRYYIRQSKHHFTNFSLDENFPSVFEDFASEGGRWNSIDTTSHPYTGITMNHEYKFIYVENRKSGCTFVSSLIDLLFGAKKRTGCTFEPPDCMFFNGCSTRCISDHELKDYFIFSIVRNPWSRFFSSMHQAKLPPTKQHALSQLQSMVDTHRVGNKHFQTQAMALIAPIHNLSLPIPLHYIGQLEDMQSDILAILNTIATRSHRALPQGYSDTVASLLDLVHDRNSSRPLVNFTPGAAVGHFERLKSECGADLYLSGLVEAVYRQDYACFGYQTTSKGNEMIW